MIKRLMLTALLAGSAAVPAAAQDAPSLVARNLEARGGAAALDTIKSVRFDGRVIFPGDFEMTYRETRARVGGGHAGRFDLSLQGLNVVQAYDGRGAWKINPFQGRKDAERMSADEARSLADSLLVEGPLLASRRDGSRVDYLGRDDFDGTLAYKLKVTQKDGDEFVYWLDPDTFLEIKVDETRRIRGAPQTTEIELGDYEKVAGVYFPMSVENWSQGRPNQRQRIVLASAAANLPVTAAAFAEPSGPGAPANANAEPPDASLKSKQPPSADEPAAKPADDTTPPSSPPQGAK